MARRGKPVPCPVCADGIAAALRSSAKFGRAFRAYRCPTGAGFHLTTKPDRTIAREVTDHGEDVA